MVKITDRAGTPVTIGEYEYDALGQRIMETKGGTNAKWRFVYDDRWRIVATMRGIDTNPKERLVPHNAGLDGRGGSSYIDTYAFQERDNNASSGGWNAASDGTLEDKHYFVQNWRADVVNLVAPSGETLAWTRYTAYGEQQQILRADTSDSVTAGKRDGGIGIEDLLQYSQWNEDGVDEADFDDGSGIGIPDGGVGIEDLLYYLALFEGGGITVPTRLGYAGYVKDVFAEAAAVTAPIYHVRHRVYNAEFGRWTRRDPLGYVDGMGLLEYVGSSPHDDADYYGLKRKGKRAKCGVLVRGYIMGKGGWGHQYVTYTDPTTGIRRSHGYWPGSGEDQGTYYTGPEPGLSTQTQLWPQGGSCAIVYSNDLDHNMTNYDYWYPAELDTSATEWAENEWGPREIPLERKLKWGPPGVKGKPVKDATCADILACLRAWRPPKAYCYPGYNCRSAASDMLKDCGLKKGRERKR